MSDLPRLPWSQSDFSRSSDQQAQPIFSRLPLPGMTLSLDAIEAVDPRKHPAFSKLGEDLNLDAARTAIRISMQTRERHLAQKAFDKVLGRSEPYPQESRESLVENLSDDYALFGLSSGKNLTEQIVRAFEDAAAAQGRTHLGKGPG